MPYDQEAEQQPSTNDLSSLFASMGLGAGTPEPSQAVAPSLPQQGLQPTPPPDPNQARLDEIRQRLEYTPAQRTKDLQRDRLLMTYGYIPGDPEHKGNAWQKVLKTLGEGTRSLSEALVGQKPLYNTLHEQAVADYNAESGKLSKEQQGLAANERAKERATAQRDVAAARLEGVMAGLDSKQKLFFAMLASDEVKAKVAKLAAEGHLAEAKAFVQDQVVELTQAKTEKEKQLASNLKTTGGATGEMGSMLALGAKSPEEQANAMASYRQAQAAKLMGKPAMLPQTKTMQVETINPETGRPEAGVVPVTTNRMTGKTSIGSAIPLSGGSGQSAGGPALGLGGAPQGQPSATQQPQTALPSPGQAPSRVYPKGSPEAKLHAAAAQSADTTLANVGAIAQAYQNGNEKEMFGPLSGQPLAKMIRSMTGTKSPVEALQTILANDQLYGKLGVNIRGRYNIPEIAGHMQSLGRSTDDPDSILRTSYAQYLLTKYLQDAMLTNRTPEDKIKIAGRMDREIERFVREVKTRKGIPAPGDIRDLYKPPSAAESIGAKPTGKTSYIDDVITGAIKKVGN